MLDTGFRTGSLRAMANDEEDDLIPGGGGVGYAAEGAVCWYTDCANEGG